MALMFPRLAHNFAKNGYYPTDEDTLNRILQAIKPEPGEKRIFDPCAGEGLALAECKHHLGTENTIALGVEYDEERAYHAKQLLNRCIHGDFMNCVITQRSCGLLFLNPPYGDMVSDSTEISHKLMQGKQRLEKLFYQRAIHSLQWGGVLIFIIPHYCLDKELASWLTQHFEAMRIYKAVEPRFQQIVIFAKRKRAEWQSGLSTVKQQLIAIGQGEPVPELPVVWSDDPYSVPNSAQMDFKFFCASLDKKQLAEEIKHHGGLWPQFALHFKRYVNSHQRSLMDLSNWHLALALAAGQVSGVVTADDGRVFIIKGDTYKTQTTDKTYEEDADGNITETITSLDKFVPVIRALDMTPESQTFGRLITIQ